MAALEFGADLSRRGEGADGAGSIRLGNPRRPEDE
jgi:hypothetical protein